MKKILKALTVKIEFVSSEASSKCNYLRHWIDGKARMTGQWFDRIRHLIIQKSVSIAIGLKVSEQERMFFNIKNVYSYTKGGWT